MWSSFLPGKRKQARAARASYQSRLPRGANQGRTSGGRDRFTHRPHVEQLETRLVPALRSGTIVVATSPYADPTSPTGLVAVDPRTGAQTIVSSGDQFREPLDLRETPDGQLYVVDFKAMQNGAVFRVDPDTGAQTVISTGGVFLGPSGIQPLDGQIYVADEGTATMAGDIVRVDPKTGVQTVVASGGDLCAPDGLTPGPNHSLYFVDFNALTTGAVYQLDLDTGAQRLIATGGAVDGPVDVSVDFSGNLIVSDAGSISGVGNLVRIDPQTGAQTLIASGGDLVNVNASTLWRNGKILVSEYAARNGSMPATIRSFNPLTGRDQVVAQGGNLDLVGGLIVYQRSDDASGRPGATDLRAPTSLAPLSVGEAPAFSGTPSTFRPALAVVPALESSATGAAGHDIVSAVPARTARNDPASIGTLDSVFAVANTPDHVPWEGI